MLFYAASAALHLAGGTLLGYCIASALALHAIDVTPLAVATTFLASSALSHALYRYFYRRAVEEEARKCVLKHLTEAIEEVRKLREKLERETGWRSQRTSASPRPRGRLSPNQTRGVRSAVAHHHSGV